MLNADDLASDEDEEIILLKAESVPALHLDHPLPVGHESGHDAFTRTWADYEGGGGDW